MSFVLLSTKNAAQPIVKFTSSVISQAPATDTPQRIQSTGSCVTNPAPTTKSATTAIGNDTSSRIGSEARPSEA